MINRFLPAYYETRAVDQTLIPMYVRNDSHPQMLEFVRHLVSKGNFSRIIFIGLVPNVWVSAFNPNVEVVYVCSPTSIPPLHNPGARIQIFPCELESGLPEFSDSLSDTIIVCSGLVEHLSSPENVVQQLAKLAGRCPYLLIATPDRARTSGAVHSGPPCDHSRTMEWTAEEFGRFLVSSGFEKGFFLGYTIDNLKSQAKTSTLAISGQHAVFKHAESNLRIAAIMHTYNEHDIIESTVRYLHSQGVEVHAIDDASDDGTYEILLRLREEGLCAALLQNSVSSAGEFDLPGQLKFTAAYAANLPVNWVIHYDADEYRCAPWRGARLAEAISYVDQLGYTAVDFTVLNFVFVDSDPKEFSQDDFRYFDFGRHPAHKVQIKAWRQQGQLVDLASSGGHVAAFQNSRVYPLKFLTMHYPLRSSEHAMKKIHQDRIPRTARHRRERGWHNHYAIYETIATLLPWNSYEAKNYSAELFSAEYLVERLSGVGIDTERRAVPNIRTILAYIEHNEKLDRSREVFCVNEQFKPE